MINFFLPDFYYNFNLNVTLIKLLQEHPEYFYNNINIHSLYGTFPGAIWNGGRSQYGNTDIYNIQNTIKSINDLGVAVRFTYSNCLITEEHLQDYYCNLITDIGHNGQNEIIINSKILENYLRKKYPNYKYILSTTTETRDLSQINEMTKVYDLIVTDYRDNPNYDFLQSLQNKDHIELLINAYCSPECKNRANHYKALSQSQLNYGSTQEAIQFNSCPLLKNNFYDSLEYPTVYKLDELYNKIIPMGFTNLKIEGRNIHPYNCIESYIYYMIKPEYKDKVRNMLVRAAWINY